MAMPPGGGSSWHHSSDSYQLFGDCDDLWAMVNTPLGRNRLDLIMAMSHSPSDFFYLLAIAAEADGSATFTFYHPLLPHGSRRLTWTRSTPVADLVPYPEVRQRGKFGRIAHDAPVVARIDASPGALTLNDARGLARLHLRLGAEADAAWPAAGERVAIRHGAVTVVSVCIPSGPGARVKTVAVSMP